MRQDQLSKEAREIQFDRFTTSTSLRLLQHGASFIRRCTTETGQALSCETYTHIHSAKTAFHRATHHLFTDVKCLVLTMRGRKHRTHNGTENSHGCQTKHVLQDLVETGETFGRWEVWTSSPSSSTLLVCKVCFFVIHEESLQEDCETDNSVTQPFLPLFPTFS